MNRLNAGGESVRGIRRGVCAINVKLEVVSVGVKGYVGIIGKNIEYGEEVDIKEERAKDRALWHSVGDGLGGG